MKWLSDHPFLLLLSALVAMLVVYPIVHDQFGDRFLFDILSTLVFAATLLVIFKKGRHRAVGLLLGIPTVLGSWVGYVFPDLPRVPVVVSFHLTATAFLVFSVVSILYMLYGQSVLTADSIYGAFCGYFLIGVAFGHLYCVVATLIPDSFHGPRNFEAQMQDELQQRFVLTYFSLMTLTTVGYGDITPAKGTARGLAIAEAIIGQFYLVVLMAELIGMRMAQRPATANGDATKPTEH